jgi:tetratricopeptide (TPR) repeat protein
MDDLIAEGLRAYSAGDIPTARGLFSRGVKEDPTSVQGWFWLGRCMEDAEKKRFCYQRALTLDPAFQEARDALDRVQSSPPGEPADFSPVPPASAAPLTSPAVERSSRRRLLVSGLVGLAAGLLLIGIPLFGMFASGAIGLQARANPSTPALQAEPSPATPTHALPSPSSTPSATQTRSPTALPTATETLSLALRRQMAAGLYTQAAQEVRGWDWASAVAVWDEIVTKFPDDPNATYQRALSKDHLSCSTCDYHQFLDLKNSALQDIDRAIALNPGVGDYYFSRYQILSALADALPNRVDRNQLWSIALDNLTASLDLGVSQTWQPEWEVPAVLNKLGRCDEGQKYAMRLAAQTDMSTFDSEDLHHILIDSDICLGLFSQALTEIHRTAQIHGTRELYYKEALVDYYLGATTEALTVMNDDVLYANPVGARRFHLRALLYDELGEEDQAQEDLSGNYYDIVFEYDGIGDYVDARMALSRGDQEQGIAMLQKSYARLHSSDTTLMKRIARELQRLGVQPIEPVPTFAYPATPLPVFAAQAGDRLSPTPTPTRTFTPTRQPPTSTVDPNPLPPNWIDATPVSASVGTGAFELKRGDTPLFHFQPDAPISTVKVRKLVLYLLPTQDKKPDIYVWFWMKDGWNNIAPVWGENVIAFPSSVVLRDGGFYFSLVNWGTETVKISNIEFFVSVETTDGAVKTYGLQVTPAATSTP